MTVRNLEKLLQPRSAVVVGASARTGSVGAMVWRNLRAAKLDGPVFAVNPKHAEIDGVPVSASIAALPQVPDLAVICTPPATVPGIIAELGKRGTRAAVVISAGLDAGQKQAMLDAARPHLLRVLGPNCVGLMTPAIGLNASFAHEQALAGNIAFVSQSGALVTAMLDWAKSRQIGFSHMVSLGEGADVDFGDLIDYLASDPDTRAILLYIESINASRKFMSAARAAARNKPVIVVKAGRAGNGLKAASSHTGAMAGSDIVFDAAIRRAGMLRVDTLQDLFMAAQTLARLRGNRDDRLTIMTNGGGAGVMAADAAAALGIRLAEPSAELVAELDRSLPSNWSHGDPIDIIGDAPVERYTATLSALLARPEMGAILFVHAPTAIVSSVDIADACLPLVSTVRERVLSCWLGDASVRQARARFQQAGIAGYDTPEEAVRAFAMLQTYRRNQEQLLEAPAADSEFAPPDVRLVRAPIEAALAAGETWLSEAAVRELLRAYRIPVVHSMVVAPTESAVLAAARDIGFPVVLKIISPQITHKSDVGGVRVGLHDEAALREAVTTMLASVAAKRPDATVQGFTLQVMVERKRAQELIVGASIDPAFGPVILFGQGGVAVEVVADRAIAFPPLNEVLARELVGRTRVSKLLAGFRDRPPAHLRAITDTLTAVSQMLADHPEIAEFDINPLLADHEGVIALDARIRVSATRPGGAERFAILPYPHRLVETVDWGGERITVRPIRPEDENRHREFADSLDPEDLRMRLFHSRRSLPRSEIARLTQIDYAREMAFVAERTLADGSRQTMGTARLIADPDNNEAEFAVIVRSDLKRRGMGYLLMNRLIRHGREQGTRRIYGLILSENRPMLDLARRCGFQFDRGYSIEDPGVVRVFLELQPPQSRSD